MSQKTIRDVSGTFIDSEVEEVINEHLKIEEEETKS